MPAHARVAQSPTPELHLEGGLPLHNTLTHDIPPEVLEEFGGIKKRSALTRSKLYQQHAGAIQQVLGGYSWDLRNAQAALGKRRSTTAVAWNVERGIAYPALAQSLKTHPQLADADLMLLTEVDIGMGRSHNRDVPRQLAAELGMGYVFANQHIVLCSGDATERDHGRPNTLALHGCALLTRYPIRRFLAVPLPEFRDKFHVVEKRLGTKRALMCEVELPCGRTTVVVAHLDPFSPPRHRGRQIQIIADALARFGGRQVLLGGDLNTNTYDLGSMLGLLGNFSHKMLRFGFDGTVRQYMTPGHVFDRPVFTALHRNNFVVEGFNDVDRGTLYYQGNSPKYRKLTDGNMPKGGMIWHGLRKWIDKRLEPYGGAVPMRLDWFAGRGLQPVRAEVVDCPSHEGVEASDHNPIVVEVTGNRVP